MHFFEADLGDFTYRTMSLSHLEGIRQHVAQGKHNSRFDYLLMVKHLLELFDEADAAYASATGQRYAHWNEAHSQRDNPPERVVRRDVVQREQPRFVQKSAVLHVSTPSVQRKTNHIQGPRRDWTGQLPEVGAVYQIPGTDIIWHKWSEHGALKREFSLAINEHRLTWSEMLVTGRRREEALLRLKLEKEADRMNQRRRPL